MSDTPRVRPTQRLPEVINELAERVASLEQALILTQSVVVEVTERLDDIEEAFAFEEQPKQEGEPGGGIEYDPERGYPVVAGEKRSDQFLSEADAALLARAKAAEAHEAAKRAASNQPLVIDGQTIQQQPLSEEPTLTPEQIAEKANSTAQEYVPTDPLEAANSGQPVPDEGIFVDQGREPGTDIQRHYDDRGNPLNG